MKRIKLRRAHWDALLLAGLIGVASLLISNKIFIRGCGGGALNWVINNLRIIEGAKDQWALEMHKATGDGPHWDEMGAYLKGGTIHSVLGETYTLNRFGTPAHARLSIALGTYRAGSNITAP
ncbi:MAG TPA: hypothetical protein VHH73_18835 [Verrucomicrobiae bacterium]|nr:hypothetical protein [Verrucomicrobiae bacterium]